LKLKTVSNHLARLANLTTKRFLERGAGI
jgi:hypothetical protein